MMEDGWIENVYIRPNGSELVADAPVGSTVLLVDNTYDFNPTGGSLTLGVETIAFLSTNPDTQSITLAAPTTVAAFEGDSVLVSPREESKRAQVNLHDDDEGVEAYVPFSMYEKLADGIRDPSEQESVTIDDESGRWEIRTLNGEIPVIDGTYIDTDTLPDPSGPTAPPAFTPVLVATGMSDAILLVSEPLDASTTLLEYHASTAEGFTPGPSTLLHGSPTRSTIFTVTELPDQSELVADTSYFFKTVATNSLGSAAPSAEVSARLDPTRMSNLVAAFMQAGDIQAGKINIGPGYWSPDEGIVVPQSDGSETRISSNSAVPSTWAGRVISSFLTLVDGFVSGLVEMVGTLRLLPGVTKPKSGFNAAVEHWPVSANLPDGATPWGLSSSNDNLKWVTLDRTAKKVKFYNKSNLSLSTSWNSYHYSTETAQSVVAAHDRVFVLTVEDGYYWINYHTEAGAFIETIGVSGSGINEVDNGHPVLGVGEAGSIMLAYPSGGNLKIRFYTWSAVGQALSTAGVTTYTMGNTGIAGAVGYGTYDFGQSVIFYTTEAASMNYRVWRSSDGVEQTGLQFKHASNHRQRGITWDGTRFIGLTGDGRLDTYSTLATAPGNKDFKYAWASEDATKETEPSNATTINWTARAQLKLTTPPPPEASLAGASRANRVSIYAGAVAAAGTLQSVLANGILTYTFDALPTTGGKAPETTNGFALVASPGKIEVPSGYISLVGDGSGRVGPLSWNSSGVSTSLPNCAVYNSTSAQNATNNVITTRTGWALHAISNGYTAGLSQPGGGQFQATVPGIWVVTGSIGFVANATGRRSFRLLFTKGGVGYVMSFSSILASGGSTNSPLTAILPMDVGDTFEFQGFQNTGGTIAFDSGDQWVTATRLFGSY